MIDRYLLRYFLAVIEYGNFSKAATACHISQPTLSIGIAKMEKDLGRPLFHRTNRRVELTEAGFRLMRHARKIEAEFAAAEREVQEVPTLSVLRLGILATIPSAWVESLLVGLDRDRIGHRLEIVEGRERDLSDRLSRGRIDVALNILRGSRFAEERLYSEGYSLALPEHHPLAGKRTIEASQLGDNPMIVRRQCELLPETSRFFTTRGVRPVFSARTASDHRALQYVAAGLGVTVMPDSFAYPGIARVPLAEFTHTRTIGLQFADHSRLEETLNKPIIQTIIDRICRLSEVSERLLRPVVE